MTINADIIDHIEQARRLINTGDKVGKLRDAMPADLFESGPITPLAVQMHTIAKQIATRMNIDHSEAVAMILYDLCDTDNY